MNASGDPAGRQVVGDGMRSAFAGVAVGIVLALLAGKVISSLLVGITSTDVTTLGVVSMTLMAAAALAGLVPAVRAARIDASRALRAD